MEKAKTEKAAPIYVALNNLNYAIRWETNRLQKENADEMTPDQLKKAYERCRKVALGLGVHVNMLYEQTGWNKAYNAGVRAGVRREMRELSETRPVRS